MALRTIGRAAGWIGNKTAGGAARTVGAVAQTAGGIASTRVGRGAILGGAVLAGVGSALGDKEGPYRGEMFPVAQEAWFGEPSAIQNMAAAGISTGVQDAFRDEPLTTNPTNYYYGQPVNVGSTGWNTPGVRQRDSGILSMQASSGRRNPVQGDIVFGMHNLRR